MAASEGRRHVAFEQVLIVPQPDDDGYRDSQDDDLDEEKGVGNFPNDDDNLSNCTSSTEEDERGAEVPAPATKTRKRVGGCRGGTPGLDMEFTRWKEAVVVVCLIFYVSDLLLDAWVLRTFVIEENIQQAWFMGFCMIVPNLYAGYKSLQWYLRAFEYQQPPMKDFRVWLIRVLFFPISLVLRYYDVLRRGNMARAAAAKGDKKRQRQIMEQFVSESAEVAMLRLFVIFLEDAPICVLNLYRVFQSKPEDIELVGYSVGVVVAKLSCSITLGVVHYASVTKVAYHACRYVTAIAGKKASNRASIVQTRASRRGARRHRPDDGMDTEEEFHRRADLSPVALLLFYCWQVTTIGSRLVLYALGATSLSVWVLLLAAARWLVNTICILVDVPNMSLANCASFGGVYLFTFVSTSTDSQYIRIALYYLVNSIEAVAVSVVWWNVAQESPYHVMAFGLLLGGTVSSILFMMIYYSLGHPNRKNTWGWRLCCNTCNGSKDASVESTDM